MIRMNQIKIRAGKEKEKYNPEYKAVPEWERKLLESKIRKQLRLKEKDTFTFMRQGRFPHPADFL